MRYWKIGKRKIFISNTLYRNLWKSYNRENYSKRQDREHDIVSLDALPQEVSSGYNVEEILEKNERNKELYSALGKLTAEEADFINRLYFKGESLTSIAESLNLKPYQCSRLHKKILTKLRELLGGEK
ncbi:MAG: sigma-70 family RNA polymerase sigma factor [Eubacterium sp.]|nr:sigma-70 family RNA polymerase sigma factor [Eubacterium sp.]